MMRLRCSDHFGRTSTPPSHPAPARLLVPGRVGCAITRCAHACANHLCSKMEAINRFIYLKQRSLGTFLLVMIFRLHTVKKIKNVYIYIYTFRYIYIQFSFAWRPILYLNILNHISRMNFPHVSPGLDAHLQEILCFTVPGLVCAFHHGVCVSPLVWPYP